MPLLNNRQSLDTLGPGRLAINVTSAFFDPKVVPWHLQVLLCLPGGGMSDGKLDRPRWGHATSRVVGWDRSVTGLLETPSPPSTVTLDIATIPLKDVL